MKLESAAAVVVQEVFVGDSLVVAPVRLWQEVVDIRIASLTHTASGFLNISSNNLLGLGIYGYCQTDLPSWQL